MPSVTDRIRSCRLLLTALALTGPGACPATAQDPGPEPAARLAPQERKVVARIDEERMQQDVRRLVGLGPRMGGTDSGQAAVEFRQTRFQELGLPHETFEAEPRWCHQPRTWSLELLPDEAEEGTEPVLLESAWPLGFSAPVDGTFQLTLAPRKGGALLTERLRFGRFGEETPALVVLDGETTRDGRYPRVRDMRVRGGGAADFCALAISASDGAILRTALDAGEVQVRARLETTIRRSAPRTVVATLPAAPGARPGFVLVCAHGDSDAGGPGANDNGSGEAIVLEIARVLAEARTSGDLPPLPAELRFAIWGSEIHSTRHYLQVMKEREVPFLGVLNFDQSGFGSAQDRFYVEPDDLPANRGLVELLGGLLEQCQGKEGFPEQWATNKSVGGTDSYVFSSSELFEDGGIPAVTLYTSAWDRPAELPRTPETPGESWEDDDPEAISVDHDVHYHSAGDTPENTTDREPWNMGWCARVGAVAALRWVRRQR